MVNHFTWLCFFFHRMKSGTMKTSLDLSAWDHLDHLKLFHIQAHLLAIFWFSYSFQNNAKTSLNLKTTQIHNSSVFNFHAPPWSSVTFGMYSSNYGEILASAIKKLYYLLYYSYLFVFWEDWPTLIRVVLSWHTKCRNNYFGAIFVSMLRTTSIWGLQKSDL